jgi:hypothetical protein
VRFAEANQAIYVQIQVGKLLPMGIIDASTLQWMPLPSGSDNDFTTLSYYDHKTYLMFLGTNNKKLFDNQAVTGNFNFLIKIVSFLNFKLGIKFDRDNGIRLKVFVRTIENFKDGKLGIIEYDSNNNEGSLHRKKVVGTKVGLKSNDNQFKVSKNVRILFVRSDEEADAGQSFLPYFDPSYVTFDQPAPLSMIELVHYTNNDDYAGYIRPVIKSLDYRKFIGIY